MKRWHEEATRTAREWKKHYLRQVWMKSFVSGEVGRDPDHLGGIRDTQKGRFRKKHAFDCGNARCHICHSDKYPKREQTKQELLVEIKLREELHVLRTSKP
jgi:hypothetical protein